MTSYATLCNPVPSVLGARLLGQLDHVREHTATAQGWLLKLDSGSTIGLSIGKTADLAGRLDGFAALAKESVSDGERLAYTVARFRDTRQLIACVIEPGLDPEADDNDQQVIDALFEMNSLLCGLLLLNDAIFDYDAECLTDEELE
jgi:hypothetical protein